MIVECFYYSIPSAVKIALIALHPLSHCMCRLRMCKLQRSIFKAVRLWCVLVLVPSKKKHRDCIIHVKGNITLMDPTNRTLVTAYYYFSAVLIFSCLWWSLFRWRLPKQEYGSTRLLASWQSLVYGLFPCFRCTWGTPYEHVSSFPSTPCIR